MIVSYWWLEHQVVSAGEFDWQPQAISAQIARSGT
jgi:hypothetical protein